MVSAGSHRHVPRESQLDPSDYLREAIRNRRSEGEIEEDTLPLSLVLISRNTLSQISGPLVTRPYGCRHSRT